MNTRTSFPTAALLRVLAWSLAITALGTVAASLATHAMAQNAPATATPVATPATTPAAKQPAAGQAQAGNVPPISGEAMAHSCAACHGTLGRLGDESFMPLAGMPVRQFVAIMIDFREGRRPATLMGHVAQGFSDAEIQAMADFFAAVPATGAKK